MIIVEKTTKKDDNLNVKWRDYHNSSSSWNENNMSLYKMTYYQEQNSRGTNKIRFEKELFNYMKKLT